MSDADTVARALGALRMGLPVVVTGDGPSAVVAVAAEHPPAGALEQLRSWTTEVPVLLLTAERAAVLHIPPSGDDVVGLGIDPGMTVETVISLADPTADLAHPLRGPFKREKMIATPAIRGAVQLCKSARLLPAAMIARLGPKVEPETWATAHDIPLVAAPVIFGYEQASALSLREVTSARVPLAGAEQARLVAFRPGGGGSEHVAVIIGDPSPRESVLTRLHSRCFTGDLLASLRCDCGDQLRGAIAGISSAGGGILLYLSQEGRGIGLVNKLRAYRLQDDGFDTVEANERLGFEADERLFIAAAQMLRHLGFDSVRLMTNNPDKVAALERLGIEVSERVPHAFPPNNHNEAYLATKVKKSGHYPDLGRGDDED